MLAAIGIFALLGYLLGSVNFAVLVAKKHGVDILKEGSGNPGATNVKRVLGKGPGNLVFTLDALKGFVGAGLPTLVGYVIASQGIPLDIPGDAFIHGVAGLIGTLLGHCFSCFLNFKGGKGVASTIGGLLVLLPVPILIGATLWGVVFVLSRYVSLASLALGLSLPVSCFFLKYDQPQFWFSAAIAAFNIWTHRSNIGRLLTGTESRFVKKA
jgi:glycerol-3-phosphate acyltransferase PlsY